MILVAVSPLFNLSSNGLKGVKMTPEFEALVKVAQDTKTPLFTAERRSVERGAIATVGYDFGDMGKITAGIVEKVLKGEKPGDIDAIYLKDDPKALSLYVNKASAEKMGVTIPQSVLDRAAHIF